MKSKNTMPKSFDIKGLFELITEDEFHNDSHPELEEEAALMDAVEEAVDWETRDKIDRLYIECARALRELGFMEGFRTAVALILDSGKEGRLAKALKSTEGKAAGGTLL